MPKQIAKKPNITRKQKIAAANGKSKDADVATSKTNNKIEYQETPVKSDCDDNKYRALKLSNGLKVVLISNPSVSKEEKHNFPAKNFKNDGKCGRDGNNMLHVFPGGASFTMSIDVGNFSDPPEIPCVSTILSNIVLNSSKNYPEANSLAKFVTKNKGGVIISPTSAERTTFYVFVSESHLVGAIERFVDCFVAPLLKLNDVEKERKFILQELQLQYNITKIANIETHGKQYLLDSIASSIPEHPGCNLGPDYKKNLRFRSEQQIFEEVEKFMKRHYSAHRMSVIIEGRLPLDTLESYAQTYFSKIPNNDLPRADYMQFPSAQCFNTPEFRMIYQMNSFCNNVFEGGYELELNWPMPSCYKVYRSKPHHYLAWIMNYKGKNSLFNYLESKGWCETMECGINKSKREGNSVFNIFNVAITLTIEGHNNLKKVLDAIFSYINLMHREGPQKRIYDEIRQIEEEKFRFDLKNVLNRSFGPLHDIMLIASPVDYLRGGPLYLEYSSKLIKQCLDLLVPEKANIIVFDCDFDQENSVSDEWEEENHNPPHYRRKLIPKDWIDYWKNIEPLPEFKLPEVNNFICDDYEVVNSTENHSEYPTIIHSDNIAKIWYKLDTKFRTRENFINYVFHSSVATESPEIGFMRDLFIELLGRIILTELYPATIAGINFRAGSIDNEILVAVSGINKKILLTGKEIALFAANLENIVTEDGFNTAKKNLLNHYLSHISQPVLLAREVKKSIIKPVYWSKIDKYTAATNVDFDKFKNFAKIFVENIHIDCLAQGNLAKSEVIENVRECVKLLKCENALPNSIPQSIINEISRGTRICRLKSIVGDSDDIVVVNYYQFGDHSLRQDVMIKFLCFFVQNVDHEFVHLRVYLHGTSSFPCVDFRESYGYFIWAHKSQYSNLETISMIEEKNEKFRAAVRKIVKLLSAKEWTQVKKSFIKFMEDQDENRQDEDAKYLAEFTMGTYIFDRQERELAMFKTFAIEDLREGMISLLAVGPGLRKISVQVVGSRNSTRSQRLKQSRTSENEYSSDDFATLPKLEFLTNLPMEDEKPLEDYITDIEKYKSETKVLPRSDMSAMNDIAEAIRRDCNV